MKITTLAVSTLLVLSALFMSPVVNAQLKPCEFTLGFDSWEPYQYVGVGREIRGLDIELIKMVTDKMDCELNFAQGTWFDLLPKLRNGEIDMLLGASKTEERAKFALFSDAYRSEEFLLYVRKGDEALKNITSFSQLIENKMKLGVVDDYYYGEEFTALHNKKAAEPLFIGAIMGELNIARLLDQDIDAFVEDSFVGANMLRRKGLDKLIVPQGLSINTGNVYVMFSKKTVPQNLVTEFNAALSAVKASGEYDVLVTLYSM